MPAPELATYRDLGSFQLLLSLQDTDALRLYCDSLLGPIENGEGQYGGELMRSLEAFIECNGQWEAAARRLYCHRHTLRYRIRRVEELTGRDLSSARDRIEFWLALRGSELVHPTTTPVRPETERNPMKVGVPTEIKTDEYRVAHHPVRGSRAGAARPFRRHPAGRGGGVGGQRRRLRRAGRRDPARRRRRVRRRGHDREGQGAPAGRDRAPAPRPDALHLPAPRAGRRADRRASSPPARPASPTRPSRTPRAGCRCWRR